jgi:hypothetical protein
MKTNTKELLQIAFFCFIAESFFEIFSTFYKIGIYKIIGFETEVIYGGFNGCMANDWKKVIFYFGTFLFYLILAFLSLRLSKNGYLSGSNFGIIVGTFCLFPIFHISFKFILLHIKDPFYLLISKGHFQKITMPLFGNLYNYRVAVFIEFTTYIILSFVIGWLLFTKYWNKSLKYKFLFIGLIASISGIYFWGFIVRKPFEALINGI